jgi:hypothetical protein
MDYKFIGTVFSEAASIRIKTDDMAFLISNGYGDGQTQVFLDTSMKSPRTYDGFRFVTTFEIYSTKACITHSDCGTILMVAGSIALEPIYNFEFAGHYAAYSKDHNVYLVLWEKYK